MEIRAAGPGDVDAAVALHDALVPYLVITRSSLTRWVAAPADPRYGSFVAVDDGRIVGWAWSGLIGGSDPLDGELRLLVRPEYRGRGIGTRLLDAIHGSLRAAGATSARVFADPASVEWATRFGYRQTRQVHYAGIDPRKAPDLPEVPSEVQLVPFTEIDPRLLHAADEVAQRTKPGDAKISSQPYDAWLADIWNSPDLLRAVSVAATHQGQVIAFTRSHGDDAKIWSRMTSTLPEYRGRGLAKLVKAAALRRAAEAGIEAAYTANYDGNTPMLAVNDWLGYDRIATHAVLICPL
ncbi:GNAT family N-acetyltransferase [Kribbella speibonae]|uniref:GNAT family N-acetyltransferase n=1 Tax=Kribbella speibonae TaxID=1572660 RepID=A0A4R0IZ94_9ACTN|nr:GNAT family N-acetyltransferase [Kribbella speibonae]TCC26742.1 GNAT family N-acetyltransferase [Kribbella speibonae]TCC38809.1 GNAT family N-acetyltransferase [Kribbella speibonae]